MPTAKVTLELIVSISDLDHLRQRVRDVQLEEGVKDPEEFEEDEAFGLRYLIGPNYAAIFDPTDGPADHKIEVEGMAAEVEFIEPPYIKVPCGSSSVHYIWDHYSDEEIAMALAMVEAINPAAAAAAREELAARRAEAPPEWGSEGASALARVRITP